MSRFAKLKQKPNPAQVRRPPPPRGRATKASFSKYIRDFYVAANVE